MSDEGLRSGDPTQVRVRTRDGVELATDIYLPDGWTSGPTILVRTPYGKRDRYTFMPQCAPLVNDRQYAFVVQDVRGRHQSGGDTDHVVHEVNDGYDTLEWIVRQGWSDGTVGMFGDSYYAYTQWAALASGHSALRAMVPRMSSMRIPPLGTHAGESQSTGTGVSGPVASGDGSYDRPPSIAWAQYLAGYWLDNEDHEVPVALTRGPAIDAFERHFQELGRRSSAFDALIPHPRSRPAFPNGHPVQQRPIPILHVLGWFDPVAKPGMETYSRLLGYPAWAPLQYLLAEATDHENYRLEDAPAVDGRNHMEDDAALRELLPRYLDPALDFFDVFLGNRRPATTLSRVRWHLGHADHRTSDQWPPLRTTSVSYHLHDLTAAAGDGGGALLVERPRSTEQHVTWTHDPLDEVPDRGDQLAILAEWPDEIDLGQRPDVLAFTTEEFTQCLDLAGPVTLDLHVSSSSRTMDLFVKLFDVFPDGTAHRLLNEQLTVETSSAAPTLARLELGHTGYRLRSGHRLRVHIASSESPHYLSHPGFEGNRWLAAEFRPSFHTLWSSELYPSRLTVTVSP